MSLVPPAETRPLHDVAIQVHADDNVCVAKVQLGGGEVVGLPNGSTLEVSGPVSPGNRFSRCDIPAGEFVRQYGQPIGISTGIRPGDPITPENLQSHVPEVRDVPDDLWNPAPELLPEAERATFRGFPRADGRVGTRNVVLIVPTSMCASHEASQIASIAELTLYSRDRFENVDGVVAIPHNKGCGCQNGSNIEVMLRTLRNYADHPNVGAVVFIDLGCEMTNLQLMETYLRDSGGLGFQKPTAWLGIQELGGTEAAIEKGVESVKEMLPVADRASRTEVSISELVLGVKCGGSDAFSGISANPALGHAADLVVRSGGTVVITEVPEFRGAEHLFAARAKNAGVAREVLRMVDWYKEHAARFGAMLDDNPSPGNVRGGLLNITIKSLGAMAKAGTTRVEGTCQYAESPKSRGVHLMQGPGYDQESTPGLVAAGCTVIVFTTGRGTTIGNAIAPVIKLSSNTPTYERMRRDIDLDAGGILDGTRTIEDVGREVFAHVAQVASGRPAKAEELKHREFQFWAEQAVSL